jgi:hypothetical protein
MSTDDHGSAHGEYGAGLVISLYNDDLLTKTLKQLLECCWITAPLGMKWLLEILNVTVYIGNELRIRAMPLFGNHAALVTTPQIARPVAAV